jgi:hypothetical protein
MSSSSELRPRRTSNASARQRRRRGTSHGLRSHGMSGAYIPRNALRAGSHALPRLRTLCTHAKHPRDSGSCSWVLPRGGRNQLRQSDQHPSLVCTWTSHTPSPSSSRERASSLRHAHMAIAQCITLCSASTLAEKLSISSPFSHAAHAQRRASSMRPCCHRPQTWTVYTRRDMERPGSSPG